jgi:protein O-mannosyl-transferase
MTKSVLPVPSDWRVWLAAVVLVAAGSAAYCNSFTNLFAGLDAKESIRDNPHIRTLWPLSEAMSLHLLDSTLEADEGSKGGTVVRRPILSLTFALNHHFLGPEPRGYHAVNLAIHLLAGLLLFGIVRRTMLRMRVGQPDAISATGVAFAVALLWTLHPVQTESVTYIVQRAESLGGLWLFLTLYCAIRGFEGTHAVAWYGGAVSACALGMGTKEFVVGAPFLVLLYDYTFVSSSLRQWLKRRWPLYLALLATWAVLAMLMLATRGDVEKDFAGGRTLSYALAQPRVLLHYLQLAVWPHPLYIYINTELYLVRPGVTPLATIVWPLALVAALLGASAVLLVRRHWLGFVAACFFIVLAPSSSIVATSDTIQEHRLYAALAAIVVAAVIGADALLRRAVATQHVRIAVAAGLLSAVAAIFGLLTYERNWDYHDEFSAIYPGDLAQAKTILGRHEYAQGRFDEAAAYFESAFGEITDKRARAEAHQDLGNLFLRDGKIEPATRQYERALSADPTLAEAYNNLGAIQAQAGQLAQARQQFEGAVRVAPDFALAYHNLGLVCAVTRDTDRAQAAFAEALRLVPALQEVTHDGLALVDAQRRGARADDVNARLLIQLLPEVNQAYLVRVTDVHGGTPR